jgi:hypothetical protein
MSMLKHRNAIVESSRGDSAIVATALCCRDRQFGPRPVFAKLRPGKQGKEATTVGKRHSLFAANENKLAFPAYEKFLARETGAIFIFVVGFHKRSQDELDRSA